MRLIPALMDRNIQSGDYTAVQKLGILNCIECGSCSYNCPAKRPLTQSFNFVKGKLREIQAQQQKKEGK
jgi:electron transport complex protein RnfC